MTGVHETLAGFVGREYESDPVTVARWQAFLWAEATRNPGERFRYPENGVQFVPPTFGQVVAREAAGTTRLEESVRGQLADATVFLGGQRFAFDRPLRVGATYRASAEIVDVSEKSGESGPFSILTVAYDVEDEDGHALSLETDFVVRAGASLADSGQSADGGTASTPDRHDGTVVGRRRIESVRAADMRLVTALVGDPNPLHFDARYAAEQGLPGRANQGPVNTSYAVQAASAVGESPTPVQSLSVRFEGFVTEGETVEALARAVPADSTGEHRSLALELLADGRTVLTGTATVPD